MNGSDITVRRADIADAPELSRLIHELAEYEKMSDKCTATPESVAAMMKEPNGLLGIIAEADGKAVGMSVPFLLPRNVLWNVLHTSYSSHPQIPAMLWQFPESCKLLNYHPQLEPYCSNVTTATYP